MTLTILKWAGKNQKARKTKRLTFVFRFVQSFLKGEGNDKGFDYTLIKGSFSRVPAKQAPEMR
jgi:hypothetical protein